MKKSIAILSAIFFLSSAFAAPVGVNTARNAAIHFWNSHRPNDVKPVEWLDELMVDELQHLYLFVNGEAGFVILPADDCVQPILGYAFDAPLSKQLNSELRYWLRGYDAQVAAAAEVGETSPAVVSAWQALATPGTPLFSTSSDTIGPLLSTTWDQGSPYNNLCPYDQEGRFRTVVGCVATAMAQIMKFWGHPSCGTGSHSYTHENYGTLSADFANTTYHWSRMPNRVRMAATSEQTAALATISYHCGVAVDMDYGASSGAFTAAWYGPESPCAENAFVQYFKYDTSIFSVTRDNLSSEAEWTAYIDTEMAARRPILYYGYDREGGHAFVLDGASGTGYYHFNWGWSGSGDGFYTVNNLAPGSGGAGGNATYTFNYNQGALFNIKPVPETFDTVDYYDTICRLNTEYTFFDYTLPGGTYDTLLQHLDTICRLHLKSISNNYIYLNPNSGSGLMYTKTYCSRDGVEMPQCTFTKKNCIFLGWCRNSEGLDTIYQPGSIAYVDRNWTFFAIWQDTTASNLAGIRDLDDAADPVTLSPNPTVGDVQLSLSGVSATQLLLVDALGRTVLRDDNPKTTLSGDLKISLEGLPAGTYTLRVKTDMGVFNKHIIKQ